MACRVDHLGKTHKSFKTKNPATKYNKGKEIIKKVNNRKNKEKETVQGTFDFPQALSSRETSFDDFIVSALEAPSLVASLGSGSVKEKHKCKNEHLSVVEFLKELCSLDITPKKQNLYINKKKLK